MKPIVRGVVWLLVLVAIAASWLHLQGRGTRQAVPRAPVVSSAGVEAPRESMAGSGCPVGCGEPKPGCEIKGNISYRTGERIYHLPGQRWYGKTVINPQAGERWFCTEEEAVANGWRRSKV
jgi:hypothetical protein